MPFFSKTSTAGTLPLLAGGPGTTAALTVPGGGILAGVLAYVLLVPSIQVVPSEELYDSKRLLELMLLGGTLLVLIGSRWARESWLRTARCIPRPVRWTLGAVVGLGVAASVRAPLPAFAALEVAHAVMLGILCIAVAAVCLRIGAAADRLILGVIVGVVTLYGVTVGVNTALYLADAGALWPRGAVGFSHIRFFNQLQTWTLPLLVAAPAVLAPRSRGLRIVLHGGAAFWWMLLLASGGRGTALGLIGAAVLVAAVYGRASRGWLLLQGRALLAGGLGYVVCFHWLTSPPSMLLAREVGAGSGRFTHWAEVVALIQAHPLLGVGPMHAAYYPLGLRYAHPHNAALQFALEWGVVAAALVAGLVLLGGARWLIESRAEVRTGRDAQRTLVRVALTATFCAAALHSLVSGVIVMPLSQVLLVLMIGWGWGIQRGGWPVPPLPLGTRTRRLQAGFLAVLAVAAVGLFHRGPIPMPDKADFHEATGTRILKPRYWQQGFIGYESRRYSGDTAPQP